MTRHRLRLGTWSLFAGSVLVVQVAASPPSVAQECTALLSLFQQGLSSAEIGQMTGLSGNDVEFCRRELSRPISVGPAGAPPQGAAGAPPRGAAGPPPRNPVGPPPLGAAGPPPVGHDIKRLP